MVGEESFLLTVWLLEQARRLRSQEKPTRLSPSRINHRSGLPLRIPKIKRIEIQTISHQLRKPYSTADMIAKKINEDNQHVNINHLRQSAAAFRI